MESVSTVEQFYPLLVKKIKNKSKRLVGRYGFNASDREDIEGQLWSCVLPRISQFDPTKANPNTFITRLVDWETKMLIRLRKQKRRDYRSEECSLNEAIRGKDHGLVSRSETIAFEDCEKRFGRNPPREDAAEMALDIEAVIGTLTKKQQQICALLRHYPVSETLQRLGMGKTDFLNQMTEIKGVFQKHDFQKFF